MLDQLMSAVGGNVISELTEKTGINAEQAKEVLPVAQESLQAGLMEQVTGGNMNGILSMFNSSGSGLMGNPIFAAIKAKFATGVMAKLGVPESVAGMVAGTGMASMVSGLTGQLKGDGDEVTQDGLMSQLGLGGGIADMAKGALGDKLGGLGDMAGGLGDAAKGLTGDTAGGLGDAAKGLGDKLGGMFGK